MKRTHSLVSAIALVLLALPACDRSEEKAEPTTETTGEQTARQESLDEQRPDLQGQPGAYDEREPVAGKEEDDSTIGERLGFGDSDIEFDVDLESAEGMEVDGEVTFAQTKQGVRIVVDIDKGPPGKKGVHIHEKGDCSDIKGKSMGGHFAPQGDQHALPTEKPLGERHLGDLGNVEILKDGSGKLEVTVASANLKKDDPMSFLGRAIVIHSAIDEGSAKQPSGNSGTPMACAVIKD